MLLSPKKLPIPATAAPTRSVEVPDANDRLTTREGVFGLVVPAVGSRSIVLLVWLPSAELP